MAGLDLTSIMNLGFPEILLWLLTFAVVYGILSHINDGKGMPRSAASRAIIAIVMGFFVLFAAAGTPLISVLEKLSSSLLLVMLGILVLLVFLETAGLNEDKDKHLLKKHGREFGVIFLVIAVLIFVAAGGMELLGFKEFSADSNSMMSLLFFGVIIMAIMWMIAEGNRGQEGAKAAPKP